MRIILILSMLTATTGVLAAEMSLLTTHLSGKKVGAGDALQPVTWGVPLPRNAVASARQLQLVDGSGKGVPCQFDPVATWDHGKSLQWVLLSFTVDPAKAGAYRLRYGAGVSAEPAPAGLKVTKTAGGYAVDTGALRFTLSEATGFLDGAWLKRGGKEVPVVGRGGGSYLVAAGGKYQGQFGPGPAEIRVSRQGPLSAVFRCEGWHVNAAGLRLCKYIVRLTASAGSPVLKVQHTFLMTEPSGDATFADIGLRVPVPGGSAARFGLGSETVATALAQDGSAALVQDNWNHCTLTAGSRKREGGSAPGWCALAGPGAAALLSVRDFWQNFPLELGCEPGALTLHFWPAHGRDTGLHAVDLANINKLWFAHEGKVLDFRVPESVVTFRAKGVENDYRYVESAKNANAIGLAKTHEFSLAFAPAGEAEAAAGRLHSLTNDPVVVSPSGESMCATGALYDLHPQDRRRFPEAEESMEAFFASERRMEEHCEDYGKWNFGDSHTSWRWDDFRFDTVYRTWRNTHHGAPRVPWLLFARSADPQYLRYGLRNTLHVLDLDYCHFTTPELEALEYPKGKIVGALNDYKGLVHWHSGNRLFDYNSMTDFALYYTYVTGSDWGREVAEQWGQSVLKRYTSPTAHREGAGVCAALIALYQHTWEDRYLPLIHAYADKLIQSQQPDGSTPQWENYAPWLERYLWLTALDGPCPDAEKHGRAQAFLVRWADAFLNGGGDASAGYGWAYHNVLACAYNATRDEKYLRPGVGNLEVIVAGTYREAGTPWDGWWSVVGGGSLAGYHFQRIPYFLSALARHGKPVRPVYPETRYWQVPVWHLRNPEGRAFALRMKGVTTEPGKLTLLAPDGRPVKTWEVAKGEFGLAEQVDAQGQKGVFRLQVEPAPAVSLWTPLTDLPGEVAQALPEGIGAMRGSRLYFHVPQGCGKLSLHVTGRFWPQTFFVYDPDGRLGARRDWDEFQGAKPQTVELSPTPAQQGKLWCVVQGLAKSMTFRVTAAEGAPAIPLYYAATAPERFFLPE